MSNSNLFDAGQRIVIKIGSSLIVCEDSGVRMTWLNSLIDDVLKLLDQNHEIIIVSSGAIALGKRILNLGDQKLRLDQKQAAASVGQIELGRLFRSVFAQRKIICGQILLTYQDTEQRRRYLNARSTIQRLLEMNVVPIVNENDTVATAEIRYGDNDRLSARVASMCSADQLIIFSDIDGLYTGPPENSESQLVPYVLKIDAEIEAMASGAVSRFGTGGMITKIQAAKIANQAGTQVIIGSGKTLNPISSLSTGANKTIFKALDNPVSARKKWIASDLAPRGAVYIDAGAVAAIENNKSLLPVGITKLEGDFDRGDILEVYSPLGTAVARGISAYDSEDAKRLIGQRADAIASLVGYCGPENLIHRDDMVVFSAAQNNKA